ncbi:hypothetical protein [Thiohalomonas denitrificans]|uniref:hypothetical protein n=1 Tax=Thiohalomonas denitrificans TaxID=415747 RepID=UPI0026F14D37|nr:hypothetical protein [Thiohalomonas denitrificans]
MDELSPAFQEAMNILAQQPLPADAEARLEELEKQIRPDEFEPFGDLWEAFEVATRDSDTSPE